MTTFSASLRAVGAFADASLGGSAQEGQTDLDRSDQLRNTAFKKLTACGYLKRGQSIGLEANLAFQRVSQASVGIERCKHAACFRVKGRAIENAAKAGLVRVGTLNSPTDSPCIGAMVASAKRYLGAFVAYGKAAQTLNSDEMNRQVKLATSLQSTLARQAKRCLK